MPRIGPFGGEKWVEYLVSDSRLDHPRPLSANTISSETLPLSVMDDVEIAAVGHGIPGIENKVEKDLLNLVRIDIYFRRAQIGFR